ncbi:MAG: SMI1/KNR4 family protein [Ruminococcus sp.]|nr:SMI1/KNR4 family protein [Ruminococcus sp.]
MWSNFKFNEPYQGEIITKINTVVLPDDYIKFMKIHNGGERDIGESWLQLYCLEDLYELNDMYNVAEFLPNHIIIGSNGGGEFYGINSDGKYFVVPSTFEINDITFLCGGMNTFAESVNYFWKNL